MSEEIAELKKEFELERMILFSDAVFAIAITLLIIEIKFPEIHRGASPHEVMVLFKPVMIRFAGFMLSFVFIGIMWARHLQIFKYLSTYNNRVIVLNLVFIFFIVCFPFTASGLTESIRPGFTLPLFIYMVHIGLVTVSQYVLCYYLYKQKPSLCVAGFAAEKKYILLQSKYSVIMLWVTIASTLMLSIIFKDDFGRVVYGIYLLPLMAIFAKRRLKKYRPAKEMDSTL